MNKKCPICKKEFKAHKDKQIYCSNKCRGKSSRLDDIKCIVCGKIFHPSKSGVKTCSKECGYKSMSLGERFCIFCGKRFKPEHSYNKYCSRECSSKGRTFLKEIKCPICGFSFKPKTINTKCCSIHCGQIFNWINKSNIDKQLTIKRLHNSNHNTISKSNLYYKHLLEGLGYNVELEFILGIYSYDLKIGNTLIEINPFAYHNSTRAPNVNGAKIKGKMYHYDKSKFAIDNGYNIILVWDWMTQDDVIDIIKNNKNIKIGLPVLHRFNKKTKEHIIDKSYNRDEMINKGFVEIYDAGEQYI